MILKFATFTLMGAVATLAHYGLLIGLVAGGTRPVVASTGGAALGACINYLLNYRFTFHSGKPHLESLPRYFAVAAAGVVINGMVMAAMLGWVSYYLVAQIFATGVVLLWNFFVNQHWTFGGERHAR